MAESLLDLFFVHMGTDMISLRLGQVMEQQTQREVDACAVITAITIDALTYFFLWQEIDYLGENSLALVHS